MCQCICLIDKEDTTDCTVNYIGCLKSCTTGKVINESGTVNLDKLTFTNKSKLLIDL